MVARQAMTTAFRFAVSNSFRGIGCTRVERVCDLQPKVVLLLVADGPYDKRVLQGLVIGALPINFTVIGRKMIDLRGRVLFVHGCIVSESYPVLMQPTPKTPIPQAFAASTLHIL